MDKITNFDLVTAFKELDEINASQVATNNKESKNQCLKEAVKPTDLPAVNTDTLCEEYYNVNTELEAARDDRAEEIAQAKLDRIEKIVDLDATSPEDLKPSYEGKVIMQCPQCMTLFYKKPEDIHPSEEDPNVVNVGEVCQHCNNDTGYDLIGKVETVAPEEIVEEEPKEEEPKSEDDLNLSLEKPEEEKPEEASEDDEELFLEPIEEFPAEEPSEENNEEEPKKEESLEATTNTVLAENAEPVKEDIRSALAAFMNTLNSPTVSLSAETESLDEERETASPTENKRQIDLAINAITEDTDLTEAKEFREVSNAEFNAMLKDPVFKEFGESVEEDSSVKPINEATEEAINTAELTPEEVKAYNDGFDLPPVEELAHELQSDNPHPGEDLQVDLQVEDLDDKSFNEAISNYLTKVYSNVDNFAATSCVMTGKDLMVEGIINFKSGTNKNIIFNFNEVSTNLFEGYCKDIADDSKFTLKCFTEDSGRILMTESLEYKYTIGTHLVEGLALHN